MDVANLEITIAGRSYRIQYALSDLRAIEAFAAAPGRNLLAMMGGPFEEKAAIIWGGLKNRNKGLRSVDDVVDLLQKHLEAGGSWDIDVFLPCAEAALLSGLAGRPDAKQIDRVMGLIRRAAGAIDDEETPEPGKAIRAAE